MSTLTVLTKIRGEHAPHRSSPEFCEACRLLDMVDTAREAISRCLEMVTKSQIDPPTMSQVLQQGLGK